MKANELMTNDWVLYGGKPTRVLQLEEGKDYKNAINPIPFAAEIFEKNGFKRNVFNGTIIYSKSSCVDIDWYDVIVKIGKDAEGIQRWDCVCLKIQKAGANLTLYNQSYFHQLQHALRLVGLGDIAENLKI